ncbi:metalloregulator ArsR/SmtB family transcription factor [Roseivivax marinus]|uniref:ArsR/SmtB family transcription factor n=1 Tax=Roseivivax marinus TaxID=1379903 RepID=UPI001F034CF6|nr:metalloregulator ArsR/SmtB family transcription factor [Roseivivax marinus]UMA63711.1 metalloregulator ArsR/SmtB family transcription factor [Roseivivax marinus]
MPSKQGTTVAIREFEGADRATGYLKTLAHRGRLSILHYLQDGEKSVGQLEALLDTRQAAVSQMLARLRDDDLVLTRRQGKTVYYRLNDDLTERMLGLLRERFR